MTRGGDTCFYRLNARGDVVAMSDESGAIVNTYSYDPWGAPLSAHEAVPDPCRCASCRYDATGPYYCWNRCYAPEIARFLTRDIYPGDLSGPVTLNPYLYCGADPVNKVDPSGMIVVAGVAITLVGCAEATPLALAIVGAAETVIQGLGYAPVHDDFERCIAAARGWQEQAVNANPDAYAAARELEQQSRREQLAAMGPLVEAAHGFLSNF